MNLKNALAMGFGVALLGSLSSLHAADAVLVQKSGTVTATMPNGTTKELSQGDVVPEGSTVTTSAGSVANIEPVAGAVATLQGSSSMKIDKIAVTQDANGTVTHQEVLLDLTSGDIVATIDPSKRAINDFKVHTPKGVAAARGTSFSVNMDGGTFSVATTADSVTFTSNGVSYTIAAGQISMASASSGAPIGAPIALADAVKSNPAIATVMTNAVAAVSNVVANNLGGLSSDAALNVMAQVVGVAANANPSQSAAYAATAATAVTSPTSATGASSSTATAAAAQVAAAAATAVPGSSVEIAAAVSNAVATSANAPAGSAASAAIAGAISQSVATATNQSVATVSAGVAAQTGNSAQAVATAASTAAATTTVNAQATTTASSLTTPQTSTSTAIITTPITVNAVSPSG